MINLNNSNYSSCITNSNTCAENKRRFEIIDATKAEQQNLLRAKVDDCIYNSSHNIKRCDYIFELKDVFSCFIELKGKHIRDAVAQLESSLQNFLVSGKKHAFVVASKNEFPNAKTERQKLERMFKTKYDTSFDMKNILMSKSINELK